MYGYGKDSCSCGCSGGKSDCCGDSYDYCNKRCGPEMTDCLADKVACIWKQAFCDAMIIPKLGVPSCSCGVMVLTHSLSKCQADLKINGLKTKSMLANNAMYSAEVTCDKWLNLYQITLPDIPGKNGCKSSIEIYTEALAKMCISIDSVSNAWTGASPASITVRSKAFCMDPCEFSKKQICAIKAVIENFSKNCC